MAEAPDRGDEFVASGIAVLGIEADAFLRRGAAVVLLEPGKEIALGVGTIWLVGTLVHSH